MKLVQINASGSTGSTGKICKSISNILTENNCENYILCPEKYLSTKQQMIHNRIQSLLTRLDGMYGFHAYFITKKQIKDLEIIKPDIVILHNIHGHNINLSLLFNWIKKNNVKVIWTFHDCWAFTGHCPHFILSKCNKWRENCSNCPIPHEFSWFFDSSQKVFQKKKDLYSDIKDMIIVTPSEWLANLVKKSFFETTNIKVINNGIDLSVFKPTPSNFRSMHGIPDNKFVLLGVSFGWPYSKGLDVFIDLANRLDKDIFQIVLVGTNETIDNQLPSNIISIHRTYNQKELAEIYSAANLFINPTREENYPTVNMESIACGTPIITFETGGSSEIIDQHSGKSVCCDDIDSLFDEIVKIFNERPYTVEGCVNKSKSFDQNNRFQEYFDLINEVF